MIDRRTFLSAAGAAFAFPALAGTGALQRFTYRQVHMGMVAKISLYARHVEQAKEAARAAFGAIHNVDKALSHFNRRSEAAILMKAEGPVRVSTILSDNLKLAEEMHRISDGRFDASLGQVTKLWTQARRNGQLPDKDAVDRARQQAGWQNAMVLDGRTAAVKCPGTLLDFGGSGKGYAVDLAMQTLADAGITSAMIELGGDAGVSAPPPGSFGWRVKVSGQIHNLSHTAVSTSGPDFQSLSASGTTYSHVIAPADGMAITNHRRLTVIGACGRDCDPASTIAAMMEPAEARSFVQRHFRGVQLHDA